MERNEKRMKDRLIRFLASIGKKHRWLAIPIVGLMVLFLTIYHAIKKFFFDVKYHKQRMRALTVAVSFVIVFTIIVLPSLAEETPEGDKTVYVEETPQPEPQSTFGQDDSEAQQTFAESTTTPESNQQQEDLQTTSPSATSNESEVSNTTEYKEEDSSVEIDSQENETSYEKNETSHTKKYANDAESLSASKPTITTNTSELTAAYGKIAESANEMKVEAQAGDSEGSTSFTYQWKMNDEQSTDGATNVDSTSDTYKLPDDMNAGVYYFYCEVTATLTVEGETATASEHSAFIKVDISRAPLSQTLQEHPSDVLSYDLSTVYYDGKSHGIGVSKKDLYSGIGDITVRYKNGDGEISSTEPVAAGTYTVTISVSQGQNYEASSDVELGNLTIDYWNPSDSYSVEGTESGTDDGGAKWYRENVVLRAPTGCKISKSEEDFDEKIVLPEGKNHVDKVYIQKVPEGYISQPITVNKDYFIDLKEPNLSIDFTTSTVNEILNTITGGGSAFNETQKVSIHAEDEGSKVKSIYYYSTTDGKVDYRSLSDSDWIEYSEFNITATEAESTNYYIYAKAVDYAGNIGYSSNEDVILDSVAPEFRVDGNVISSEKKYVADTKTVQITDSNLSFVSMKRADQADADISSATDMLVHYSISEKDGKKQTSIDLACPNGTGGVYKYFITAKDASGNGSDIVVVMADPVSDVTINSIVFDNQIYGYEDDSITPKGFVCTPAESYTELDSPNITSLEILELENTDFQAFTVVDGTKIKPVNRLHAGDYSAKVRVHYNSDSTIISTCSIHINKAQLNVEYRGQDVWYHTLNPNFTNYMYVSGFKYGESPDLPDHLPLSYTAPVITNFVGPAVTMGSQKLIPGGGNAADYVFAYTDGFMNVVRRTSDKYTVLGTKGSRLTDEDNAFWYTDAEIIVAPNEGYSIGKDDSDLNSFSEQGISIDTDSKKTSCEFYILNETTGEISDKITFQYGKDSTPPEGNIALEESSLRSFLNTVTFGNLFRDTVNVDIHASDTISDIDSVQYGISETSLDGTSLKAFHSWKDGNEFKITPDQAEKVFVYGKITNGAGLVTYVSSGAVEFDAKDPQISGVTEGANYIEDAKQVTVLDNHLTSVTLFEGANTTGSGKKQLVDTANGSCTFSIHAVDEQKQYTILAEDATGNQSQVTFSITKPVYDVSLDDKDMGTVTYGYEKAPSVTVSLQNKGNASVQISDINLGDDKNFSLVQKENDVYEITAKKGLKAGEYSTKVILFYNGSNKVTANYTFTVEKATLKASYKGDNVYYNMTPDMTDKIDVTGFVNGETPESVAGYETPTIEFEGTARETQILSPQKGRADNYSFDYVKGVLNVTRNTASVGTNGQYTITGTKTDTGWYNSDICIKPNAGFTIVKSEDSENKFDSLTLKDNTDSGQQEFYLKNTQTGELYKKTVFLYMKDDEKPVISGVDDAATYENVEKTVTVSDTYLASVTVNGTAQAVSNGTCSFTLAAGTTDAVYVIVARDRAGNMVDKSISFRKKTASSQPLSSGDVTSDDAGRVNKKAVIVSGAPTVGITSSSSDLAKAALTNKELAEVATGKNANIVIKARNIDSTVSQNEKEIIIASLNGFTLGQYIDLTMSKTLDNEEEKKISNLNKDISVTVNIPDKLLNTKPGYTRLFAMICVHNGKASFLNDQDSVANTLTVFARKFSTYALIYKDVKSSSETNKEKANQEKASSSGNMGNGAKGTSPATGDGVPLKLILIVLSVSFVGIIICSIAIIKRKGRKES